MTDTVREFRPRAATARIPPPAPQQGIERVYVLFTSIDETLGAVRVASRLAKALGRRLIVVHARAVAFAAPLETPSGLSPVETEAFRTRLEAEDCEAEVRVCLCRDAHGIVPALLDRPSLVVLGRHRRWWPTRADRWRRELEAAGHLVVVVDEDPNA
jgi:hypothetical protein